MITVGVDLAAQDERTAMATVEWSAAGARVIGLSMGVADEQIVEAVVTSDQAGIDCPFGWPEAFVDLVTAHRTHSMVPPETSGRDWRRNLVLRETDIHVHERIGLTPLSVSADRIGHVAFRCAALLSRLESLVDCRRDGSGRVAEVYPAGALKLWGLLHRGYKRSGNHVPRGQLVEALVNEHPWVILGSHEQLCRDSDDAFDAVICALVAKAVHAGLTETPPAGSAALTEGWIHLPTTPLDDLMTGQQPQDGAATKADGPTVTT